MEEVLRNLTLGFFGKGKHKIEPERLLQLNDACLLDVRLKEEADAVSITLKSVPGVECRNIP